MLDLRKRRQIQDLLESGRSRVEVAAMTGVSLSSVKRIAKEPTIEHFDDAAERRRRRIGRPSVARIFRGVLAEALHREPRSSSADLLRLARRAGYDGGKTAIYTLVAEIRSEVDRGSMIGPGAEAMPLRRNLI